MITYLFSPVFGTTLTLEPTLTAILAVFVVTTLVGAGVWLLSRRYRHSDPLAHRQLGRLGQWLCYTGIGALIIAACFYEDALFNRRFWLFLMLVCIYAVVGYALYSYFRRYPALERAQEEQRSRRQKYVPTPHSLGKWGRRGRKGTRPDASGRGG